MFLKAIPVYAKDLSEEMNTFVSFPISANSLEGTELHITAAAFYQVRVNGTFIAFGPARTAKGYARKDVLSLDEFREENNEIRIDVAGYYCKSFNGVKQPSFLQAELRRGNEILYATDKNTVAYVNEQKLRKVFRYSLQRQFSEVWDLSKDPFAHPTETEAVTPPKILDRVVPYPAYNPVRIRKIASRGTLTLDETPPYQQTRYSGKTMSTEWGKFPEEEIRHFPYTWIQRQVQNKTGGAEPLPVELNAGQYAVIDFGRIECGFLTFKATATRETDLILGFSEGGSSDRFEFTNMNALNAAEFLLAEGENAPMTFEPYTAKYVIVGIKSGSVLLKEIGITTYEADTSKICLPDMGDETLNAIARGAVRTYAHNAVDLYSDCPSRERAGWLCDSYFTAKTEHFLFGEVPVEKAFLENYRLYEYDGQLPEGVLPMSYPSDIEPGNKFIPQWTMWYILQVADHLLERATDQDRQAFRPSVEGLLKFYQAYENEDGLLERLPSWNFVEWSAANQWTWDVNYPTNFLYSKVLQRVADLYEDEALREKGKKVAQTALRQSFDGEMFLDHALRDENGTLVRQKDCSETCQYYALLLTDMDPNDPKYSLLMHRVFHVFGAERKEPLPEIEPLNAFIGVYLRLETFLKLKAYDLVLQDVREFFGKMEQETGTLWEYREGKGSRDHGFASYALVAMKKALDNRK